jgi:hypothetical protein
LLAAISASDDDVVRRLGTVALMDRLDGLAPERLLTIPDASLVCLLLSRHPAADALDRPPVVARLIGWLVERNACAEVAALVSGRGQATAWAPRLVEALAQVATPAMRTRDPAAATAMVESLHAALQIMTRTQRNLAVYAGHWDGAVKDWRDVLAANGMQHVRTADAGLMAAITDVPNPAAVTVLLTAGAAADVALDQAMAGADRTRRRELMAVARLVARRVSPRLWRDQGDAGFDCVDADDPRTRLDGLRRLAEAVRRLGDPDGLIHLLTWTDDRDPAVRAMAFDLLVRLSDQRSSFGRAWELKVGACFPPEETIWRLRRAVNHGEPDERVAALQLIASLRARELVDDVLEQLAAANGMVVDTALETLGRLDLPASDAALLHLIEDAQQPVQRRITALELRGKVNGSSETAAARKRFDEVLTRLATNDTPTLRQAAQHVQLERALDATTRMRLARSLLAGDTAQRLRAVRWLDKLDTDKQIARASDGGSVLALALSCLADADSQVAGAAAELALGSWDNASFRTAATPLLGESLRTAVRQRALTAGDAQGPCLALALRMQVVDTATALGVVRGLSQVSASSAWRALLSSAPGVSGLGILADSQDAGVVIDDRVIGETIAQAFAHAMLTPSLRQEALAIDGDLSFLSVSNTEYKFDAGRSTRILTLPNGATLTLVLGDATSNDEGSVVRAPSTLVEPMPPGFADDDLAATIAALKRLKAGAQAEPYRRVVLATLTRTSVLDVVGWENLRTVFEAHGDTLLRPLLADRDPAIRHQVVEHIIRDTSASLWDFKKLLKLGNSDLLPAVVACLTKPDNSYIDGDVVTWMKSLPPETLVPHTATLLAHPHCGKNAGIRAALKRITQISLRDQLVLLAAHHPLQVTIAPFDTADEPVLTTSLTALSAQDVLDATATLRRIRAANPVLFDRVMRPLASRDDVVAAAWLRTGLPFDADWNDLYRAALGSAIPDMWQVGAAFALKTGAMDAATFLDRVITLPSESASRSAAIAARYLQGRLTGEAPRLARILQRTPARMLGDWIALCPPGDDIAIALAQRVRDPATAELVAAALVLRLREDRTHWQPVVDTVAAAANGRLDGLRTKR